MTGCFFSTWGNKKEKYAIIKEKKKINTIYMILKKRYCKIYDFFRSRLISNLQRTVYECALRYMHTPEINILN